MRIFGDADTRALECGQDFNRISIEILFFSDFSDFLDPNPWYVFGLACALTILSTKSPDLLPDHCFL